MGGSSAAGKELFGAFTSGTHVVEAVPAFDALLGPMPARLLDAGLALPPVSMTACPLTTDVLESELPDGGPAKGATSSPEGRTGVVLERFPGNGTEFGRALVGVSRRLDGTGRAIEERANIDAIVSRPPSCRLTCRDAMLLLRDRT